jgi:hypothetical protein
MPLRARVAAKMVKWDMDADWWPTVKDELLSFDRGTHDDIVDALSWLVIGLSQSIVPEDEEAEDDEDEAFSYRRKYATGPARGRSKVSGY